MLKSYHDRTMAQGTRIQVVLPSAVAELLKQKAKVEGRTVSSLGSFLIEAALKQNASFM
jgi:hypothetical protein